MTWLWALLPAAAAIVTLWIIWRLDNWLGDIRARRALKNPQPLFPESRFIVRMTDTEIACERPDRKVDRVAWDDLQKIEIVTTDSGPYSPDVFWVLHGTTGGCAIPQGATGDKEMIARLQELPGFDNGAVIEAMTCIKNARFLCWERKAES